MATIAITSTTIILAGELAGRVAEVREAFLAGVAELAATGTVRVDLSGVTELGRDGLGLVLSTLRTRAALVFVASRAHAGALELVTRRTARVVRSSFDPATGMAISTTVRDAPAATVEVA